MDRLQSLGCVACEIDGISDTPGEIHHIVQGQRRLGHLHTLILCPAHHRGDGRQVPSVHFTKRQFVQRYGSELELLAGLQVALGIYSKVIT
jgi:Recombination enhancement, RecA-dependent nuclease